MPELKIQAEVRGRILALPHPVGAVVEQGDEIAMVEAMKMEIPIASPASGRIKAVLVSVDEVVEEGQPLVVIDTAGFRNRTMIEALSVADLAVIPIKASPLDIAAAIETVRLIEEVNATDERRARPMDYRLLLTQVTVGSAVARHVRSELAQGGYALFETELANRVVYAEASIVGRMPIHLDAESAAARDGEAFAREVRRALGW